mmetsp:Transcript_27830/g.45915  ORF Transcript_27830/g.45915 Transcript_27830/m.45915 type:complete len:161 (+) Transcript_27830:129-611(+)|eukprot:CAMPEP_0202709914 /NCGR_PEP_ID=MMETSP1385-20130828/21967_1 /ASSEMBLY_ACC=CAM_ASM_000861 /TAXON_ID=933848 /ORGANISM="Elphidium margaritaceum" /LENGTH=160 /DNA_ID=CAMNT_0049369299 /DNA_START=92 /DNA_END=574 /DNA_ORIENTATION=-
MYRLLLLSALIALSFGHMCLLNPYQRPGYVPVSDLSTVADEKCGQTTAPCGTEANDVFINAAIMSEKLTVVMLKNLNHYNRDAPGNFTVNFLSSSGGFVRDFGSVPDDARPSGSLYELQIPIPHEAGDARIILQAIYYPNNSSAPEAFYQCADLEIFPRD